jgi:hypothetical protein
MDERDYQAMNKELRKEQPTSPSIEKMELNPMQKLNALQYKYYQGGKWIPKEGDFYTTSRADLELYKVVEVTDTKIKTKYCLPERGDSISEWDKETFLTEGFGVNRVYVPEWIFAIKANNSLDELEKLLQNCGRTSISVRSILSKIQALKP